MRNNVDLEASGELAAYVLAPPGTARDRATSRSNPLAFCRRFAALFSTVIFLASCASSATDITGSLSGSTGSLAVVVNGLAGDATASITISNAVGFSRAVTGAGTLTGLPIGQYDVVATEIQVGAEHYVPSPATQSVNVTSSGASTVAVTYALSSAPATGSLNLTVLGLPAGASAALTVTGPGGYSLPVSGSQNLTGLMPGSYAIAAAGLTAGGITYAAQPTSQVFTVSAGATTPATVSYAPVAAPAPTTGSLALTVDGLPAGVDAAVSVTGPNSYVHLLTATETISGLVPGSYTVTVTDVTSGSVSYTAQPGSQTLTVSAGASAAAHVTYAVVAPSGPTVGALAVSMSGLLPGTNGNVTVTGPDGFSQQLTGSQSLSGLAPGSYTVTASSITSGGMTWSPSPASQQRTVVAGGSVSASVSYSAVDGALAIAMPGVPAGFTPSVTVTGPGGFSQYFTSAQQLTGLLPGTYTITANSITVGAFTYSPTPATQTRTVVAGAQAAASVGYGAVDGALTITVTGVASGSVTVNGPGGFSQVVTTTRTITGMVGGSYVVSAANVSSGGSSYAPQPPSQSVVVTPGTTVSASVAYSAVVPTSPSFGALAIAMTGLPGGVNGSVTVRGPGGFNQFITAGQTLSGLALGSYTVDAGNVSSGGTTYSAAPASQIIAVTNGVTSNATITYTAAAPAPPTTGGLAVTMTGLPGGTSGSVTVNGPGGFSQVLAGTQTLSGLTPGGYTVVAADVASAGTTYTAATVTQWVTVSAGATATTTVSYGAVVPTAPSVGDLAVITSGLPGGANGSVDVTGPGGFSRHLTGTQTLSALSPGHYTVTASALWTAGATYVPVQGTVARDVVAGSVVAANVTYGPVDGGLSLVINGLPVGATANVMINGSSYSAGLPGSGTQLGLPVGSYTLSAASVNVGGTVYSAAPVVINVTAGTVTAGTMTFSSATGSLSVSVTGTPGGTGCNVLVTGPGGYSQLLTGTQLLSGLAPGTYTIAAVSITAGGVTYAPSPASQTRTVSAGGSATANIVYSSADAGLTLTVSGLPGGTAGSVTLTGPGGYSQFFTGSQSLTGLTPGSYTLNAGSVSAGGFIYSPAPGSQNITVTSGSTASASVVYTASGGSLTTTISGLPGGTNASVTVSGPGGYSHLLTGTQSLTGLAAGSYTITASSVSAGGTTYTAIPASQSVTVTNGATASATVAYSAVAGGGIAVTVSGLPAGASGNITVTGPGGFSQVVNATQTLSGLTPGSYALSASNVWSSGFTWAPTPATQSVTVTSGATATASVAFAATAGALTISQSGLPAGVNGNVVVTGPGGFSQTLLSTQTLTGMQPGTYLVTVNSVSNAGTVYTCVFTTQNVTVTAGATAGLAVVYSGSGGGSSTFPAMTPGYHVRSMVVNGMTMNYQVFIPQGYNPANTYPVIVFAHGSGETGTDNQRQLTVGLGPYVTANASTFPAIVVFPQQPAYGPVPYGNLAGWFTVANDIYKTALDSTLRQTHADSSRLYMTGVSLGGFRTWGLAYAYPNLFAAIAPISGGMWKQEFGVSSETAAAAIVVPRLLNLPIWQWQGDADTQVPIAQYIYPIRDAFAANGNPSTYHLIIAPGRGHELEVNYQDPAFWAWLLSQHR